MALWPSSWLAHGQGNLWERGSVLLASPCIFTLHGHVTHIKVIFSTLLWWLQGEGMEGSRETSNLHEKGELPTLAMKGASG